MRTLARFACGLIKAAKLVDLEIDVVIEVIELKTVRFRVAVGIARAICDIRDRRAIDVVPDLVTRARTHDRA